MPAPRIKLSTIKRSLPEPILPVLNQPVPAGAVAVASQTPWCGVPVPTKRGSTAPFDPPQPFVAPEAHPTPASGETAEPFASPTPAVRPKAIAPTPDAPGVPPVPMADEVPAAAIAGRAAPAAAAVRAAPGGSFAAAALSLSRAKGVGTLVPAGTPGALATAATASPAGERGVDGSGALLTESSQPGQIRATAIFLKWTLFGMIGIAIAFALIRFAIPFFQELRNPGGREAIADKDAPTAVRMLQQTREVVAKNDANAAYLNEIAATVEPKAPEPKPAPAPVVTAPVAPAAAVPPPTSNDLTRYTDAVERMKVDSVVSGAAARAMIDGRRVRLGDIVNRPLGLRFVGVDVDAHAVLFTNADNVVFKKYY